MKIASHRKWILAPFILPFVLIIRLIRPFILIRTEPTYAQRIGHFATNMEIYLCEKDHNLHPKHTFDIFFHAFKISNHQLKIMWNRHPDLYINQFAWFLFYVGRILPNSKHFEIQTRPLDTNDVFNKSKTHLQFTLNEEETAQKNLLNIGVTPGSTFIGLIARDGSYLKKWSPTVDYYSRHSYRDSKIGNYLLAAEELSSRGHSVLRMGVHVEEAMKTNNPNIIDYASKNYRTDLLDVYIAGKCHFFVSGNAGFDNLPMIFRRPLVLVNYVPFAIVQEFFFHSLIIFKKYWLNHENRKMTFREIIESGVGEFLHSGSYEENGIELIENTPEEIRDVVIEMDERLRGTYNSTEEDEELQQKFWSLLKPKEGISGVSCRIGSKYLRHNRDLLE